ncbi:manganese-dependent inorganic pyrophosphatase [Candidatus Woesearchaeota archaeon]|nr:manganese-dependent inorganic pyrophosphatase [Candidatus Woesearchaeota archaeon]
MGKIYVVGHKNPDTDTIVCAITMADFLNKRDKTDIYEARMSGKPNSESEFIFNKFGIKFPAILEDAKGKQLYLVDHNETSQYVAGAEVENVVGILDHHKINFENTKPIEITTRPLGSSNSIVYCLFERHGLKLSNELKPLVLCAILSDTVILKSPTTAAKDREIVGTLSKELNIDYQQLGMEMFKAKSQISEKSAEHIIYNDFKKFDFHGKKVGIGQVETPDLREIEKRVIEIKKKMEEIKEKDKYHSLVLMLTDIIEEGTKLIIVSKNPAAFAKIFNTRIKNNLTDFIPGMMSRKKQVVPMLIEKL